MTGFARIEGHEDLCAWTWEVKSVNGKGRDIRLRLPSGFERLEQTVRERAAGCIGRGNVTANLNLDWTGTFSGYRVNGDLLDKVLALLPEIEKRLPEVGPPRVDGILGLRGIIEPEETERSEEDLQALDAALLKGLDIALEALCGMRADEGARLAEVLGKQIDEIEGLCASAAKLAATQPDAIKERLRRQVSELMEAAPALSEERLAQEAAVLMVKADVREELDRLHAHVAAARELLSQDGAVGRKLDFLCQEFNREANTLCSKSADVELTRLGLDFKAAIEQFREQVQNIE